jgi:hypothetical protein
MALRARQGAGRAAVDVERLEAEPNPGIIFLETAIDLRAKTRNIGAAEVGNCRRAMP